MVLRDSTLEVNRTELPWIERRVSKRHLGRERMGLSAERVGAPHETRAGDRALHVGPSRRRRQRRVARRVRSHLAEATRAKTQAMSRPIWATRSSYRAASSGVPSATFGSS